MRASAILLLLALAACGDYAKPGARRDPPAIALRSVSLTLPATDEPLPPGPNRAAVSAGCTACHSPGMLLAQPPLKHEQWQAIVTKMREAYKAPVAEADDAAILAYLDHLSETVAATPETR